MAHPPGSSSLVQQETTRHRALLVVFLVSAGVCLSFDQLGKWWAFASWREPAAISQVIPGLYACLLPITTAVILIYVDLYL